MAEIVQTSSYLQVNPLHFRTVLQTRSDSIRITLYFYHLLCKPVECQQLVGFEKQMYVESA